MYKYIFLIVLWFTFTHLYPSVHVISLSSERFGEVKSVGNALCKVVSGVNLNWHEYNYLGTGHIFKDLDK